MMKKGLKGALLAAIVGCFLCISVQNAYSAGNQVIKLSQTVAKDEKFTLPKTTKIKLAGGKTKSVTIVWNKSKLSTTTTGKFVFNGSIKEDKTKLDLMPYKPKDWPAQAYISKVKGSGVALTEINVDETAYLNCAFINNGSAAGAESPKISLYINGDFIKDIPYDKPVKAKEPIIIKDFNIGKMKKGLCMFSVRINYGKDIKEANYENNASTFDVYAVQNKELSQAYYENPAANFKMRLPQGWYIKDSTGVQEKKTNDPTVSQFSLNNLEDVSYDLHNEEFGFNAIYMYTTKDPEGKLDEETVNKFSQTFIQSLRRDVVECKEISRSKIKVGNEDSYLVNYDYNNAFFRHGILAKAIVFLMKYGDTFYIGIGYSFDEEEKDDYYKLINKSFETFAILEK